MPFQKLRNLELENKRLTDEVAILTAERDAARQLAAEISHMLTYACEQSNRHGLVAVPKG